MSAQYLPPVEDFNAHVAFASDGEGGSVGQTVPLHGGEQKSPVTPWIWMACSSEPHPFFGSS
jgi:hypothetical protein